MSFPKYEVYKDSGVEWLGEVPNHWEIKKISRDIPYLVGWTPPSGKDDYYDGDYPWVTIADMTQMTVNETKSRITDLAIFDKKAQIVPAGSMLFSFKLSVGKVSFLTIDAYTNEAIAAFLPSESLALSYWKYAAPEFIPRYGRENIYGATLLNQDLIGAVKFFAPDKNEQIQIANFLDRETTRIDALIAEQQRLIELLKEKRQAVISHAVTKGLDRTAPMKDSGVEWLGKVPEHWEVAKFKWFLRTASGGTPPSNDRNKYYDGNIPWLRSLDLNNGIITEYEIGVTQKAIIETACKIVPKNSVLIAMYGGDGTIGKNGLLMFDSAINQAICAFLPSPNFHPSYLHLYIQFYRPYWMIGAESSRKDPNIGQDRIGDHYILKPSLPEQQKIIEFVENELLKLSELAVEADKAVDFLQERRSALISAAVTGKIDVRNWQPSPESTATHGRQ